MLVLRKLALFVFTILALSRLAAVSEAATDVPEAALRAAFPQVKFDTMTRTEIPDLYEVTSGINVFYYYKSSGWVPSGKGRELTAEQKSAVAAGFTQSFPQVGKLDTISSCEIPGLFEITGEGNVFYYYPERELIFTGEIVGKDLKSRTAQRKVVQSSQMVKGLPLDKAVRVGNGKKVVVEFTDPDCPYCRKASEYFARRSDVTRYVFFSPLAHPDAIHKIHYILGASDKVAAYEAMMRGGEIPASARQVAEPVKSLAQEHLALAKKVGVKGTPTFFMGEQQVVGADLKKFEQLLEQDHVAPSQSGGTPAPSFEDDLVLTGEIIDKGLKSRTAERRGALSSAMVDQLPLEKAVKLGDGPTRVIEFTDPDCPYCRKGAEYFHGKTEVTRYVFLSPLAHPAALNKVEYILGARSKADAYEAMMSGREIPSWAETASAEVKALAQEHLALARRVGVQGTPTFFIRGQQVVGVDTKKIEDLMLQQPVYEARVAPVAQRPASQPAREDKEAPQVRREELARPQPVPAVKPAPQPAPAVVYAAPRISISSPSVARGVKLVAKEATLTVIGKATDSDGVASVTVNNQVAALDEGGNFSADILLKPGQNEITVTAVNVNNVKGTERFTISRESAKVATAKPSRGATPGAYFALIIGNNAYRDMEQLKTAVNDATVVENTLRESYGFTTKLLLDATRGEILSAINEFRKRLGERDNLLIYYAGHGEFDREAGKAYWLPVDAQRDNPANWIIADDITSSIKRLSSRHVLIVSDSCYSGTLTRSSQTSLQNVGERDEFLQKMVARPSRTLMASGGNEPVADGGGSGHSVFADSFIRGLKEVDRPVFSADELFSQHIRPRVAGRSDQVPEYHEIRNSGHDGGDFVFVKSDGK